MVFVSIYFTLDPYINGLIGQIKAVHIIQSSRR